MGARPEAGELVHDLLLGAERLVVCRSETSGSGHRCKPGTSRLNFCSLRRDFGRLNLIDPRDH
jgi:hypothetical protein